MQAGGRGQELGCGVGVNQLDMGTKVELLSALGKATEALRRNPGMERPCRNAVRTDIDQRAPIGGSGPVHADADALKQAGRFLGIRPP
jgi:hypothetical protein